MKRRKRNSARPLIPLASLAGFSVLRAALFAFQPGSGLRLAAEWAGELLFALLPALFGLFYLDGDESRLLPPGAPEAEHIRADALCGALCAFPFLLLHALLARHLPGETEATVPLFLPALVLFSLVIPVSRALLERGLLAGERKGALRLLLPALFFAATGGAVNDAPGRFFLALILQEISDRQDSLAASILTHAAFGVSQVLLSLSGLAAFLCSGGMAGAAALMAGSLLCWRALLSALSLSPCRRRIEPARQAPLKKREAALLLAAPILLLAATAFSLWLLSGGEA